MFLPGTFAQSSEGHGQNRVNLNNYMSEKDINFSLKNSSMALTRFPPKEVLKFQGLNSQTHNNVKNYSEALHLRARLKSDVIFNVLSYPQIHGDSLSMEGLSWKLFIMNFPSKTSEKNLFCF